MATYLYPSGNRTPSGVIVEVVGGVFRAQAVVVSAASGLLSRIGSPVTMTAEGTNYNESLSGETISIPAYAGTGETGAFESNGRRYKVALSDLGITSTNIKRWCHIQANADSFSDVSEARAGTQAVTTWLGSGSATDAVCGVAFQRPSTGTAYTCGHWDTSDTALINVLSSTAMRGILTRFLTYAGDYGQLHSIALDADGDYLAGSSSSGTATTNAAPTHICCGLYRTGTNPSAFSITGFKALYLFGPFIGTDGL